MGKNKELELKTVYKPQLSRTGTIMASRSIPTEPTSVSFRQEYSLTLRPINPRISAPFLY